MTAVGVAVEAITPDGQQDDFIARGLAAAGGDSQAPVVETGDSAFAVAGSIGVQKVQLLTLATVGLGVTITSTGPATVKSTAKLGSQNLALAGGLAGGDAAVGGALVINLFDVTTKALVLSDATTGTTTVDATGAFAVTATASLAPIALIPPMLLTAPGTLEERTDPGTVFSPHTNAPDRPLVLLPGIGASFAGNDFRDEWFTERGIDPEKLQIDALGQYYDDLITTLRAVGYTLDVDLFIGNYDWRMNPGPVDPVLLDADLTNDVFDGTIAGLTGASLTDDTFTYGVDYLGYWLKKASNAWLAAHGSRPTDVDIVSHSTGGIVARVYMQSDAYGDVTGTGAGDFALPKIHDLIMVGVPNRGASKAYNLLANDWNGEPAFAIVLSKVVNEAWLRLIDPLDPDYTGYISGSDYDIVGPLCVFGTSSATTTRTRATRTSTSGSAIRSSSSASTSRRRAASSRRTHSSTRAAGSRPSTPSRTVPARETRCCST